MSSLNGVRVLSQSSTVSCPISIEHWGKSPLGFLVNVRIGGPIAPLTLAQILEAGTWKAGRELAEVSRPNTKEPPIGLFASDGTVPLHRQFRTMLTNRCFSILVSCWGRGSSQVDRSVYLWYLYREISRLRMREIFSVLRDIIFRFILQKGEEMSYQLKYLKFRHFP
jgi:hypothetical protein